MNSLRKPIGIAAVALIAVAGILLQPVCLAADLHVTTPLSVSLVAPQDPGENETCCSLMPDTALVQAPQALASHAGSGALAYGISIAGSHIRRPVATVCAGLESAAPPPVSSYHARSARILS